MKYQLSKSKAKLAAFVLASTLAIGVSANTFADEVNQTDTPVISDTNPSDTPVIPSENPSDTPSGETGNSGTDTPLIPSESSETGNTGASDTPSSSNTDNSGSTESSNDDTKTETSETENPNSQEESNQPTGEVTVPTEDGGTATVTPDTSVPTNNPNVSADTAKNAGASQVGTTSKITGQIVQDVTSASPVYTNTGVTIISTKNGQVVLSNGEVVAPEKIGAKSNADGTISVTTKDGKKETLPNTGINDIVSLIMAILGGFLLVFGMTFLRPSDEKMV